MIPKQRQRPDVPPVPAETLAAAIAGDREAFGEIYRTHHDEVYRFVYYRVTTTALAEDITAETFAKAIRNIGSFASIGSGMIGWLVTIARNLINDHFKSSYNRRENFTTDGEMRDADVTEPGPETFALIRLEDQALRDAVGRLCDTHREIVELRFLQGLTVTETAAVMGKLEGAVKTLQWRAVRALARNVAADRTLAEAAPR